MAATRVGMSEEGKANERTARPVVVSVVGAKEKGRSLDLGACACPGFFASQQTHFRSASWLGTLQEGHSQVGGGTALATLSFSFSLEMTKDEPKREAGPAGSEVKADAGADANEK